MAAPDDPMRMATFDVAAGQLATGPEEIFLDRDSLTLLDVAVGDTVTVQTPRRRTGAAAGGRDRV